MRKEGYDIITHDVLTGFFDGTLDRTTRLEIESLKVRDDDFRQLMVDYEDIMRLREFLIETPDSDEESTELLEKMNQVVAGINANEGSRIRRGTLMTVAFSLLLLLVLFASLLHVRDPRRVNALKPTDMVKCAVADRCVGKQAQVERIDSLIARNGVPLPRYVFMERYMSEDMRGAFDSIRSVEYELTWQKLRLLDEMRDEKRLRPLVREYVLTDGCHRIEAKNKYSRYLRGY